MPSNKSLFLYLEVEVCGQPTELDHIGCGGMYVKAVRQLNCDVLESGGMPPGEEADFGYRHHWRGLDDYLKRKACPTGQEKGEEKCPSSAKSP